MDALICLRACGPVELKVETSVLLGPCNFLLRNGLKNKHPLNLIQMTKIADFVLELDRVRQAHSVVHRMGDTQSPQ